MPVTCARRTDTRFSWGGVEHRMIDLNDLSVAQSVSTEAERAMHLAAVLHSLEVHALLHPLMQRRVQMCVVTSLSDDCCGIYTQEQSIKIECMSAKARRIASRCCSLHCAHDSQKSGCRVLQAKNFAQRPDCHAKAMPLPSATNTMLQRSRVYFVRVRC